MPEPTLRIERGSAAEDSVKIPENVAFVLFKPKVILEAELKVVILPDPESAPIPSAPVARKIVLLEARVILETFGNALVSGVTLPNCSLAFESTVISPMKLLSPRTPSKEYAAPWKVTLPFPENAYEVFEVELAITSRCNLISVNTGAEE